MLLNLKCLNCGAALTIPETVSQMACGYCGVVQQVQREGGGVWLSLEKALADVKASSDRAANEMALRRLREEREDLRGRLEEEHKRIVEAGNQSFITVYAFALLLVIFVALGIVAVRIWDRDTFYSLPSGNLLAVPAIAVFLIFAVMLGVMRHRGSSVRDEAEANTLLLEDQIADLDRQIEEQRRVANGERT